VSRSSENKGLVRDQTITFASKDALKKCPIPLRRIVYQDQETGAQYTFLTNHFKLAARTIADIYKNALASGTLLQMDQAKPQDQIVCRNQQECCYDANLDRIVRLFADRVYQIPIKDSDQHASDNTIIATQSV